MFFVYSQLQKFCPSPTFCLESQDGLKCGNIQFLDLLPYSEDIKQKKDWRKAKRKKGKRGVYKRKIIKSIDAVLKEWKGGKKEKRSCLAIKRIENIQR